MGNLHEKVAIVTGSGQGIGQGIAFALAEQGAQVAVVEIIPERAAETVAEIRRRGCSAQAFSCDVKVEQEVLDCVAAVVESYGSIDILINNAQESALGPLLSLTRQDLETDPGRCLRMGSPRNTSAMRYTSGKIGGVSRVGANRSRSGCRVRRQRSPQQGGGSRKRHRPAGRLLVRPRRQLH